MQQQPNEDRLDRIERIVEGLAVKHDALASTAAEYFSRIAQQQEAHEARMAEIQAKHEARMNDHEEALLDHEEEHSRLLRAHVLIAEEPRETSVAPRRTEQNLAEATEKLNGLIAAVDDFIRRQPKQ